jgi:hypothetical protein
MIDHWCKTCVSCQLNKPTACPPVQPTPLDVPDSPWKDISMDWVWDCLKVMKAMMQSLNVVDRFTKWAIVTLQEDTGRSPDGSHTV